MKTLILYFAKRYIIGSINDFLKSHKNDVESISKTVDVWTLRLEKIIEQLKRINTRISDGQIETSELSDSIKEVEELVRDL